MRTSAAEFDRWYADRVESPVADELVQRVLGLPPELQSTSLLSGDGLEEVVAALDLVGLKYSSLLVNGSASQVETIAA